MAPNHVWIREAPAPSANVLGYETTGALIAATARQGPFVARAAGGYAMVEKKGVGPLLVRLEGSEAAAARLQQLRADALAAELEADAQAAYDPKCEVEAWRASARDSDDDESEPTAARNASLAPWAATEPVSFKDFSAKFQATGLRPRGAGVASTPRLRRGLSVFGLVHGPLRGPGSPVATTWIVDQ